MLTTLLLTEMLSYYSTFLIKAISTYKPGTFIEIENLEST